MQPIQMRKVARFGGSDTVVAAVPQFSIGRPGYGASFASHSARVPVPPVIRKEFPETWMFVDKNM